MSIPITCTSVFDLNEFIVLSQKTSLDDNNKCCYVLNLLFDFSFKVIQTIHQGIDEKDAIYSELAKKLDILSAGLQILNSFSLANFTEEFIKNTANAICIKECVQISMQCCFQNTVAGIVQKYKIDNQKKDI